MRTQFSLRGRAHAQTGANVRTNVQGSFKTWTHRLTGALLLALVMGLMTWRTALGGINAWRSNAGSMMLGFPEWVIYTGMVPALALTTTIGLVQAVRGFGVFDGSDGSANAEPA